LVRLAGSASVFLLGAGIIVSLPGELLVIARAWVQRRVLGLLLRVETYSVLSADLVAAQVLRGRPAVAVEEHEALIVAGCLHCLCL